MARTIQDKPTRARLMREYDSILQEVESLPTSFGRVDILDEQMASLNAASLSDRFGKGDHLVICIGRTYGSAGTDIGFALADALNEDLAFDFRRHDCIIMNAILDLSILRPGFENDCVTTRGLAGILYHIVDDTVNQSLVRKEIFIRKI